TITARVSDPSHQFSAANERRAAIAFTGLGARHSVGLARQHNQTGRAEATPTLSHKRRDLKQKRNHDPNQHSLANRSVHAIGDSASSKILGEKSNQFPGRRPDSGTRPESQ